MQELGVAIDGLIRRTFERNFPDRHATLTGAWVKSGLAWFRSVDDPKTRWVDGTPSCTGYAGVLAAMFPQARFINLVREPEAVIRSWMAASFRAPDMGDANALTAHIYHLQRAGYLTHSAFGDRTIRVIFEDLVTNRQQCMLEIVEWLGEEYSPHCIEPLLEKINSSGTWNSDTDDEFATVANDRLVTEMKEWYRSAREPHWRLQTNPAVARAELEVYAAHWVD